MRKPLWLTLALVGVILLLEGLPLSGQTTKVYGPFVPTPEYLQAYQLLEQSGDAGLQKYAQIAAQNPGTTLGATCLFDVAYWGPSEQKAQVYQSIIAGYPQSRFEVLAKLGLLNIQFAGDTSGYVSAADQLAQSYGGPSLTQILRGSSSTSLSATVRALPLEIQLGLLAAYSKMYNAMANELGQYQRALPLATFNMNTFSLVGNEDLGVSADQLLRDVEFNLVIQRFGNWNGFPEDILANPQVRVQSPEGRDTGPRPKVKVEMSSGGFENAQINLSKFQCLLDGQDFKPMLSMRTTIDASSIKSGKRDDGKQGDPDNNRSNPFERIQLSGRPLQPLTQGVHTLALVVPVIGYQGTGPGITSVNLSFRVTKPTDDPEDERDDT